MEKDFHIELIKAINEPKQAKWDYLDNLRKETKHSKAGFIAKLKEANNNIFKAWKELEMESKFKIPEIQNLSFPYNSFFKFPELKNFSTHFHGQINEQHLKALDNFIRIYELRTLQKEYFKLANKTQKREETDKEEECENKSEDDLNPIENKFNSMPIEEVREHFRPLTEKKNKISGGRIWMAKEDFEIFLRRSFGGETNLPKPKINIGPIGKYAVVKLFHSFYEKTLDHPYNGPREKDPVLNLLKDAFKTSIFDNLRKDNFKSDKSKYPWS